MSRTRSPRRPAPRVRLQLEALEERLALNNRFVVPLNVATDGSSTFHTLKAALTTGAHSFGEVIQIEPGSAPGSVSGVDLATPGVNNLTIRGNPAAPLASIPQFLVTSAAQIGPAERGFTFKNVN